MSTDYNNLKLTIAPSSQAADGHSTIKADATAYIDNSGTISYPDPPVEIVFELPEGMGAVFKGSPTSTTTSRKTLTGSGRIETPVYFYSDKTIENGILKAYWKDDKENTLQKKSFTFTSLSGFIKPSNNFAPADGTSTITLEVGLLGQDQEATISFNEKTKTVTFDPPSVMVQSGKTATTKATCHEPGAFFVRTEVGTAEIDFIAKGPLTAADAGLSTDVNNPTQLDLADYFNNEVGWFGLTYYMLLPQFNDHTFSSLSLDSTSMQWGNKVHFMTSDGSIVDPQSNDIALPGSMSDMNPMQYYIGVFYSKEKNLWIAYGSNNPEFGLD